MVGDCERLPGRAVLKKLCCILLGGVAVNACLGLSWLGVVVGVVIGFGAPTMAISATSATSATSAALEPQLASRVTALQRAADEAKKYSTLPSINLFVGQVKVIERSRHNIIRVAVGNGSLLKANVIDARQIILIGEGAGETTMHLWLKDGSESAFTVMISPQHTARLKAEVQDLLSEYPDLRSRLVGNKLLIEGRYRDAVSSRRVKSMLAKYPEVVNLVLDDYVDDRPVRVDPMIYLDLQVVEVRKRALDQLGIKWASAADGPSFSTSVLGYANAPWPAKPGFPAVNTARPAVTHLGLASQITSALQFLEQNGDSWTLAEPRLSCKSGGKSKFVAGGEVPIPVSQGPGQTSVVYKQYGVVIEFNPVADSEGNIESLIEVEVSEPDPRNSNQGFVAFTTNRTSTQVALKHNTPLVISGLLRQQGFRSIDALPGLSKVPVLGRLFSANEERREESELLVVVTPRLITSESALNTEVVGRAQGHVEALRGNFNLRLAD